MLSLQAEGAHDGSTAGRDVWISGQSSQSDLLHYTFWFGQVIVVVKNGSGSLQLVLGLVPLPVQLLLT